MKRKERKPVYQTFTQTNNHGEYSSHSQDRKTEPLGAITFTLANTKDKTASVSAIDADLTITHPWHYNAKSNQIVYQKRNGERRQTFFLHREVAERKAREEMGRNLTKNDIVEYKDGNKLNNTRENLRIISRSEHSTKAGKKYKGSISGFIGVHYHKRKNKWEARITTTKSQRKSLGYFDTPEEANKAIEEYQHRQQNEPQ